MLLLVAVAPLLGAASTLFIKIPESQVPLYLSFLAGFLLYIGATHVLPQAHQDKRSLTFYVTMCLRSKILCLRTRALSCLKKEAPAGQGRCLASASPVLTFQVCVLKYDVDSL